MGVQGLFNFFIMMPSSSSFNALSALPSDDQASSNVDIPPEGQTPSEDEILEKMEIIHNENTRKRTREKKNYKARRQLPDKEENSKRMTPKRIKMSILDKGAQKNRYHNTWWLGVSDHQV